MTLAELLASKKQGTGRFPGLGLVDLLARRNEPLDAKFNPSGVGPGVSYGSLASILADFAPGIGDVKSAADAIREAEAGNYGMSLADAFGALPLIGGMGAIKAFHGSPHKFDAFDMSKIGTGEGAQAYGHGLYFAEDPGVANYYGEALQSKADKFIDGQGKVIDLDSLSLEDQFPATLLRNARGDYAQAEADLAKWSPPEHVEIFLPKLRDMQKRGIRLEEGSSNLYETSLEWPDPAREAADPLGPQHFLDWDKPLSEQPESIQKALDGIINKRQRGENAVAAMGVVGPDYGADAARLNFLDRGIPGIRYLDQGSRGAGNGTYNYVVFDDKIPRIISRNGVTLADLLKR